MHQPQAIRSSLIALLWLMSSGSLCYGNTDEVTYEVTGKVTDEQKVPVKHALVILTEKGAPTVQETHTDHHGFFSLSHPPAGVQALRVVPPPRTGLAQASITDIPGDEGRHVLISVRKGFTVQGRVLFKDEPVKHVTVRVIPQVDSDTVHGGGETQTDGHGQFSLVLTPGQKNLEISGMQQLEMVASFQQRYNVTGDATIPDIHVPPSKAAGHAR